MSSKLNRRHFLATTAGTVSLAGFGQSADPPQDPVAFFLVGDTHFLAEEQNPAKLDARSAAVTSRLIDVLNTLPGTEIPADAGGGQVRTPQGVIHAGDCIDTGDKSRVNMQQTEWAAFADAFGLNGGDGRLKWPVYEVHGNHDSPRGDGLAVQQITARNTTRRGLTRVSGNGLHYSWDWGGVHFINLGIVVGEVSHVERRRRYAPLGSLEFLVEDLQTSVGDSGRPVVITHHVDVLRYSHPLPVEDKKAESMEWDPADVSGYHTALKDYSIAAILYGHTHGRNVFHWNGSGVAAREGGIPVFNVDNSSHFAGKQQAFFYLEIDGSRIVAREYQTKNAWESGSWTPQTWTAQI